MPGENLPQSGARFQLLNRAGLRDSRRSRFIPHPLDIRTGASGM
jgi:hypothetical protein